MTTGTKCCEHYKDGLPYCVDCEMESTKAHDKACALLAEARADADHWKSECNALQRMVHEARADVKDRDNALAAIMAVLPDSAKPCDAPDLIKHFKSQMLAFGIEYIRIEKQLKEVRSEIEIMTGKLKTEREFSERRGKLIEQLCKGLEAVICVADRDPDEFTMAKAALSAAKRM